MEAPPTRVPVGGLALCRFSQLRSPVECQTVFGVAGTQEGAVQLWDMREASTSHANVTIAQEEVSLRSPTYGSDCLASGAHNTPVTDICALPSAADSDDVSIATLDQEGTVIIWLVLESDVAEFDLLDYGQAVGARVRLLKSAAVLSGYSTSGAGLQRGSPSSVLPTRCVRLAFLPSDPSRFVVGDDLGHILHHSRYSDGVPAPRSFETTHEHLAAAVSAVSFSQKNPGYFIASRADGSLALYHVNDGQPLLTLHGFATGAIVQLSWATTRPSMFWVLDSADNMHVFDLLHDLAKPVLTTPLQPSRAGGGGGEGEAPEPSPMRFALDVAPPVSRGKPKRMVALTFRRGGVVAGIEVHVLSEKFGVTKSGEEGEVTAKLEGL